MAKDKKMVDAITSMDEDFAKWYTDICMKAELVSYTSVKGCMVIRPYGYAIWENIQHILDTKFKELGHENVCMPMFIPESLLQKEKDHVEGFAPEVAWVTYGGSEKLEDRLCVRPTSETLFCEHYANIVHSYRDLPKLYNQWVSVVRWEKTTRPFLRSREFLWQEGHTIHETPEEAIEETERMLNVYADFCEQQLAMPVVKGRKTESDKFAGAEATYAIEALMHDGKALQAGTSHYFGDGFAKAFGIFVFLLNDLRADAHTNLRRGLGADGKANGRTDLPNLFFFHSILPQPFKRHGNLSPAADHAHVVSLLLQNRTKTTVVILVPSGHNNVIGMLSKITLLQTLFKIHTQDLIRFGKPLPIGELLSPVDHRHMEIQQF